MKGSNKAASKIFAAMTVFMLVTVQQVVTRPNHRAKRVSDSHLADLETKMALHSKIKGFAITMPVGGGRIDPIRIGRKRRSDSRFFNTLFEPSTIIEDYQQGDPTAALYNDMWFKFRRHHQ